MDHRGTVGRIYKEDHYILLQIKYKSSGPFIVLQIYMVFYRDPEIGFKLFFLTDSCSQDIALQESD